MTETTPEQHFAEFRARGRAEALGAVFDALAPQLLLVAAHLAGGGSAEDLVQATFVDAIRHRQRWDERRPLAPWLCGILANHVRLELRRRRRHGVPDATRLPPREVPDPSDAAAAAELAETVRQAVAALPRQYHQVLTLRFVHGLELQQIAHSLRLPLGTVKTRLYRGMALVKRALPAGLATAFAAMATPGRGLVAVREVVLGHAGAAAGAAATTTGAVAASGALIGAVWMQKLWLAAALVVVAVGGWLMVEASRSALVAPGSARQTATAVAASTTPPPAVPPRESSPGSAPPAANERIAAPVVGSIAVRAVWGFDGAPAADIGLQCWPTQRRGDEPLRERTLRTDADGRARIDQLLPGNYCLGCLPAVCAVTPEVCLVKAGAITDAKAELDGLQLGVTVIDASGAAVAEAEVWADRWPDPMRRLGSTDRHGQFACRTLRLDAVLARKAGVTPSMPADVARKSGRCDLQLVLDTVAGTLRGIVVDPDGRQVPDALVVLGIDDSDPLQGGNARRPVPCRSGADGRFLCREARPGEHTVMARAAPFATSTQRVQIAAQGETDCTLVLQVGGAVMGRVTDRAGRPLVDAVVSTPEDLWGMPNFRRDLSTRTDGDGRYRLGGIRAGTQEVTIAAEHRPSARRWFELRDGDVATWDATLPEGADIAGRVVDGDGKPLALWRVVAAGSEEIGSGVRSMERAATTNRDGRFTLAGLPDLPFRIAVHEGTVQGPSESLPRAVVEDVRPPRDDLVIRIHDATDPPGWITARVVRPAADAGSTVFVAANPGRERAGNGPMPQDLIAAPEETVKLGPLPAGDYVVSARLEGRTPLVLPRVHLAAGQNLELPPFRFDQQQPLRLRLRRVDGHAAKGATLVLVGTSAPGLGWLVPREDKNRPGDYVTEPLRPGDYEMRVHGPGFAAEVFQVTVGQLGETLVEHVVQPGTTVAFHFVPAGPPPERGLASIFVQLRDAHAELVSEGVPVDGKGAFDWTIDLRPGSYTLEATARPGGAATVPFIVRDTAAATPIEVQLTAR